jgi:hypothetical protein
MKMLLTVDIPHQPFNRLVRSRTAGDTISKILDSRLRIVLSPDDLGKAGLGMLGKRWA